MKHHAEPDIPGLQVGKAQHQSHHTLDENGQHEPVGEREVRTALVYQVRVFVCNPEDQLRLGMPAMVILDLKQEAGQSGGTAARDCGTP